MIDVIIPAYNAHSTIEDTIQSICYQTIHDKLKVYLVNDKSDKDYKSIVDKYKDKIDITEIDLEENSGPGVARETGMMASNSEFIVFIDSDDEFSSKNALSILYNTINDKNLDIVIGAFVECLQEGTCMHTKDPIRLHGKIFRRSFLEKWNIHFNKERVEEDNFFLQCVLLSDPKTECIDDPVYVWKFNPNSITRKNNFEYNKEGVYPYLKNMIAAFTFAINSKDDKVLIGEKALCVLYYIYYNYINDKNDDYLKMVKPIKDIYDKYKDYIEIADEIYDIQYDIALYTIPEEVIKNADITFEEFCNMI